MESQENQSTYYLLNDTLSSSPVGFTAANIAKYYPENTSFWMYAMIGLGSSFMVFVVLTIYLLCKPEKIHVDSTTVQLDTVSILDNLLDPEVPPMLQPESPTPRRIRLNHHSTR